MNTTISTIERTGSNYLYDLMQQNMPDSLNIFKRHQFDPNDENVITIVRDPKDAILSRLAMAKENRVKLPDITMCSLFVNKYVVMGENLYNEAKIIIDYNDLISHPEKVIQSLAKEMNLTCKDFSYESTLKDDPANNFLVTSKNTTHYNDLKPLINTLDFTKAYEVYNKMLSRAIDI